ncbi:MAG: hypothetical protein SVX43_19680 [Cyanobacteriota bacterium]|nr:hypothetical protein [Cyanobacteriota bacterium]
MTKIVKYYFIFGAFLLSFPFLLSLNLPFAYWDWLMVPYYQLQGDAVTPSQVPHNLFFSLFLDKVHFRPLAAFLTNLQYVVFKGEFWAWYLTRWVIFGLTVYFIYKTIIQITGDRKPALLSAVFFMLHPMPMVADVLSQDAYVSFFASFTVFYLVRANASLKNKSPFALGNLNRGQYSILFILFTCTSFSKEISVSFTLPFVVLILLNSRQKNSAIAISKSFPFLGILGFSVFRILGTNHPSSRLNKGEPFDSNAIQWGINQTIEILFPQSPLLILSIIIVLILILGITLCLIYRKHLAFLCLYSSGLCLAFVIIASTYPCPKYLPTPVLYLSLLIGLAASEIFRHSFRLSVIVVLSFCLCYPAFTLPDIYAQWFAMQQSLYEMSDIIQFMYQKEAEGYALAFTNITEGGDLPWEKGATFDDFFEITAKRFYNAKTAEFFLLPQDGIPSRPFVLLTGFAPNDIEKGRLTELGIRSLAGFSSAYQFERNNLGFFATATEFLKGFEHFIGNTHPPTIGCASPVPSTFGDNLVNPYVSEINRLTAGPHLLYIVDPAQFNSPSPSELEISFLTPNRKFGAFSR